MTREEVRDKVREVLVQGLFERRHGWTVTDEEWEELEEASRAIDRGEGIAVDDVDAFLDQIEREISS